MIYDEMKNLSRYLGLHPNLDTAIQFLVSCDLRKLSPGRNEVDGEQVYINLFGYETIPERDAFFEAHEVYADIHMLISGEELIGVSDPAVLKEFARKPEEDFIGYQGEVEVCSYMAPNKFLIAYPGEAHMVKLLYKNSCHVEKAVVKVKI